MEKWSTKKKDEYKDGIRVEDAFNQPFSFGFAFSDIEKMMQSMLGEFSSGQVDLMSGPIYKGFSLVITPDGKKVYKEFGNSKQPADLRESPARSDREPVVEFLENKKLGELKVIVEMPGVTREEIKLDAKENSLGISTSGTRKYAKEIELPTEVESNSVVSSYTNGILEVKMKTKTAPATPNGESA
jgi:HSP20 family protein